MFVVQCDHSIDSNCADCYYDGTEAILKIPAVWVILYLPKGFPMGIIFCQIKNLGEWL